MDKQITVSVKNVYGEEKIYPVCESAQLFAKIAGTKTLTLQTLHDIKRLGYKIVVSHAREFVTELQFA